MSSTSNAATIVIAVAGFGLGVGVGAEWLSHRVKLRTARRCSGAYAVCSGHPVCTTDPGSGDQCGGAG